MRELYLISVHPLLRENVQLSPLFMLKRRQISTLYEFDSVQRKESNGATVSNKGRMGAGRLSSEGET